MGEWRSFIAERNEPILIQLSRDHKTNKQTNQNPNNSKTRHMTRRNSYRTQEAGTSAGRPPQLSVTLREKLKSLNSEENADLSVLQPGGEVELKI